MAAKTDKKIHVLIEPADDGIHKFKAVIIGLTFHKQKTVRFGAIKQNGQPFDDYTIHKDKERLQKYIKRHQPREMKFWTLDKEENLTKPSFWSLHLLWNEHADTK
jgi:hypothetical protein